ncbi:MAG: TetR/AcrR family transcriptional regulator [Spirochaetes bacterium]|nr:TetR/AcrR family transcriptional regulator [Spirochaetota bacterium]
MENKDKILKTALELFASKGYDGVGVQEIAKESGFGKPTLYHYYQNKQGLLQAILDSYFAPFLTELVIKASYQGDIKNSLVDSGRYYFTYAAQNQHFIRMKLAMGFAPRESTAYQLMDPFLKKQFSIFEDLFTQAANDHGNMKDRQMYFALSYIGLLNTYISLMLMNKLDLTEERIYKVVHQFMHGIFS